MRSRDEIRRLMLDVALGQATAAERATLHRALTRSEDLRREQAEVEQTLAFLRTPIPVQPSPRLRESLSRRLDRIHEDTPIRAMHLAEEVWFRVLLIGFGLRTSRRLQLRLGLAAAALCVGMFLITQRPGARANPQLARVPTDPSPVVDGAAPKEAPALGPERGLLETFQPLTTARAADRAASPPPAHRRWRERGPGRSPPLSADFEEPRPPLAPSTAEDETFDPVAAGTAWLCREQRADGTWTTGGGEVRIQVGVTGLAVLALQSAPPPERSAAAAAAIERGVQALLRRQDTSGCFGRTPEAATTIFNHAAACLALLDEYAVRPGHLGEVQHGVDQLEIMLGRLFQPGDERRPCDGQNAAWACLALERASSLEGLVLAPHTEARIDAVLLRLRNERRPQDRLAVLATEHHLHAMRDSTAVPAVDPQWMQTIAPLLANPARQEPALRYLVAAAMVPANPTAVGHRQRTFGPFFERLERGLLEHQRRPAGFFPAPLRWFCFNGGHVYETALSLLALQVARRPALR